MTDEQLLNAIRKIVREEVQAAFNCSVPEDSASNAKQASAVDQVAGLTILDCQEPIPALANPSKEHVLRRIYSDAPLAEPTFKKSE